MTNHNKATLGPDTLRLALPEDYECGPAPCEGGLVHTPFDYPDGGVMDVFVLSRDDGLLVTDHGDVHGWLHMQFAAERLTPAQRSQVDRICAGQDVKLDRGRLMLCGVAEADIAEAIERVAGAVARIAETCAPQYSA